MIGILLTSPSCNFGGILTQNQWVGISLLVAVAGILIASIIYTFGNILPGQNREKLKSLSKFEFAQIGISIITIAALLAFSQVICGISLLFSHQILASSGNIGAASADPFTFSMYYVSELLFDQGTTLQASIYSTTIGYSIVVNLLESSHNAIATFFSSFLDKIPSISVGPISLKLDLSSSFSDLYNMFIGVLLQISALVIIPFAILTILYLLIPIIQSTALVVIIPVSIIMRMLSFTGPKLREAASALLAIGIAFYFILPLTIVMDAYMVNWMQCTGTGCNAYSAYLNSYSVSNLPISGIFTNQKISIGINPFGATGAISVPLNIFANGYALLSTPNLGFSALYFAPSLVEKYIEAASMFLFQGIVLISLDMVITIGFAMGLAKSFNAVSDFLGVNPSFW